MSQVVEFDIAACQHIEGVRLPATTEIEVRMCDHQINENDTDWCPVGHYDFFPFTLPVCSVPHASTCNQISHLRIIGPFEIAYKK